MGLRKTLCALGAAVACLVASRCVTAQSKPLVELRFTDPASVARWQPTHDVSAIEATSEGMAVTISGPDPYIQGPVLGVRSAANLWLRVRVYSEVGGTLQAFHYEDYPTEGRSVHGAVRAKRWTELAMALPPLSATTRVRLDPPGTSGRCIIAWLRITERKTHPRPDWPPPARVRPASTLTVRSGPVTVGHAPGVPGALLVSVDGYPMAAGWSRVPVCYTVGDTTKWVDLATRGKTTVAKRGGVVAAATTATDPDGATWTVRQTLAPGRLPGVVDLSTVVTVNKPRNVSFLPMVALFPGAGSFGTARERGLFAGLEYLDKPDRSSSEDDLRGEQAKRLVPDAVKVTFPLMAMQARGRYVGLIWNERPWLAAAYDTPDRSFGSRANAMAILFPGSDGVNRSEGSLVPYDGRLLEAGYRLTLTAHIIGGAATGMTPAIERYVALRGLPPTPPTGMGRATYARWAAGGWLDSRISEGARYRHAYWPNFPGFAPQAAADPATWMEWLAISCNDAALAARLRAKARDVLNIVDASARNFSTVSHVTYPVQTLLFGDALVGARHARRVVADSSQRFEADGTVLYRAAPGQTDYGSTHFERHANGFAGAVVSSMLANALVAGDTESVARALQALRTLDRCRDSAPRGAQTWEVPLHTPDILASALLVKAYTIGYELTGDARDLAAARHWAWTGVPFVYLVRPVADPIGLYATIAVYGATGWVAPNWMGLPVQWCGLVYSDALYRLARYDRSGPWRRIAEGITASGIQQSWPSSDRDLQGLLPDSVTLKSQNRNAVAITPGTVQPNAVRLYGGPEAYDYRVFREPGAKSGVACVVHAAGEIVQDRRAGATIEMTVRAWYPGSSSVLVTGLAREPSITVDGRPVDLAAPGCYDAEEGRAAVPIGPAANTRAHSPAEAVRPVRIVIKL